MVHHMKSQIKKAHKKSPHYCELFLKGNWD